MKLSERFARASKNALSIAKDPYMIGVCFTVAACALPFSAAVAGTAVAAPVVYAAAGGISALAEQGLKLAGR